MEGFAKKRGGGDGQQKPQTSNPDRQAIAANAKIHMKGGRPTSRQSQPQSKMPARGVGNAQNISAAIQNAPIRRGSGPKQKYDPYDTDAESIDTTVNQSDFQTGNIQPGRQNLHFQPGHNNDFAGGESEEDEDRSNDGEGDDEEEEVEGVVEGVHNDYNLTNADVAYLENKGLGHLSRDEAVEYLLHNPPAAFPDVDGDSYPTTTNGDVSERQGEQDPTSDAYGDGGSVSPSPQQRNLNGQLRPPAPPLQRGPVDPGLGRTADKTHVKFNQATALRNQQRANMNLNHQPAHGLKETTAPLPSSQPPSYSQVIQPMQVQQARQDHPHSVNQPFPQQLQQPQQPQQPQQNISRHVPGPSHVTVRPAAAADPRIPAKQPLATRTREVPRTQQPPVQREPTEYEQVLADYDVETLHKMKYDQLKNESFDLDPRAPDQPLGENMREKPLNDRLEHVQKHLDPQKQADFFRSLATTEWEDAGDWFLEQFSSVILRTKNARQNKRKLAEGFETEIEKRHKHISKKQRQVEQAMEKMKAQGEGLVPRSPRHSRSPKPKRG